jgi:hypothetical protein
MIRVSSASAWLALAAVVLATGAQAQDKPTHKYIGVDKCAMCHKSDAKGNQYGLWLKSAHAKAFETLAGEKALAIGKEKGLAKSPQETDACLKCHVTGWGQPATAFEATFKKEQGVGCESCHGAGSDYKAMDVMKDQAKAVAAGLVMPDEKTCTVCHNSESPSFKAFDFKASLAKIAHPNPAKKG